MTCMKACLGWNHWSRRTPRGMAAMRYLWSVNGFRAEGGRGREEGREGGKEGEREGEKERGRKRGRERGREGVSVSKWARYMWENEESVW